MIYRKRNKVQRRSFGRALKKVNAIKTIWLARYRVIRYLPQRKFRKFRYTYHGMPQKIQAVVEDRPVGDFFYCERKPNVWIRREWKSVPGIRKCGNGYEVGK